MKAGVIIGGIAIVVAAALALLWPSLAPKPAGQEAAPAAAVENTEPAALVTPIASQVFAMEPGADFAEIATSTEVEGGTKVKTSETGRAIIEGTHEAFLDFSAEVVVASNDSQKGSRIKVETGKTWSRAKKTFDGGEFDELETPNAVAVVRGTSFGLYYEHSDTTTLIVTEGEVHLIAKDPKTGEIFPDTEVAVTPGKKAVRKGDAEIVVSAITAEDKGEWFRFNNPDDTTTAPAASVKKAPVRAPVTQSPASPAPSAPAPTAATEPPAETTPPPAQPFTLDRVSPTKVDDVKVKDTVFALYGTGLDRLTTLRVGGASVASFSIASPLKVTFRLSWDFPAGTHGVSATEEGGAKASLSDALTIVETQRETATSTQIYYPYRQ